jgi:protoporphyrinogen oxidase
MFGYVPGGYARVLESFAQTLSREKVCIKLRHTAKNIERKEGQGIGIQFENGRQEIFDQVVLTMAAAIAAGLCPALSTEEKAKLRGIQYQGIICASLLLKRSLGNFYVTNITDPWVPFTAVIEMSALVDQKHFGGNALVYLPKYVTPDDPAFSLSDGQIEEKFVDALTRMYPDFKPSDLICFRVSRVKYVLALSTLNYSERLPPMTTSVRGLHIINSAHICNGTLNVNETVQLAEKAATTLLSLPSQATSVPLSQDYQPTETSRQSFTEP